MSSRCTFRLLFVINRSKSNKEGAPIQLRITISSEKVVMNLGRRIPIEYWDIKNRCPKNINSFTSDLTLYMELIRNRTFSAYTELKSENDVVTPAMVRDKVQGKGDSATKYLLDVWDDHNLNLKKAIGKDVSYTLWQKHNACRNHFSNFLKFKYRTDRFPVKNIKYAVIRDFESYLRWEVGLQHNTTIKFLQKFKKITIRCMRSDWLKKDPFEEIALTLKEIDRSYLTEQELKKVANKNISNQRLGWVKDLFLLSCYTGLSYSDVKKMSRKELEQDPNGLWWIKTRRKKTNQRSQIPLFLEAKEIIDRYSNLDSLKADDLVLNVMSNQKLNAYLKEVADLCRIEKKLTYHVARHTFATTVTLQNGVSIESVSRMMGHTNIRTTQHYAKVVDKKIANEMKALTRVSSFRLSR